MSYPECLRCNNGMLWFVEYCLLLKLLEILNHLYMYELDTCLIEGLIERGVEGVPHPAVQFKAVEVQCANSYSS